MPQNEWLLALTMTKGTFNERLLELLQRCHDSRYFKKTTGSGHIDKLNGLGEGGTNRDILHALGEFEGWKLLPLLLNVHRQKARGKKRFKLPDPATVAPEKSKNIEGDELLNLTDDEDEGGRAPVPLYRVPNPVHFEDRERSGNQDGFAIARVGLLSKSCS